MHAKIINYPEIIKNARINLQKTGFIEIVAQTIYIRNKSTEFMPSFNALTLICYKDLEKNLFGMAKSNNEVVEKISLDEFKEIMAHSSVFNNDFYSKALDACSSMRKIKP